jgi:hypothetical protein
MPEVGGDWVIYVDPHNVNDGYQTITGLLSHPERVVAREQALRESYQPLTWRAATAAMLDIIATANAGLPGADPDDQDGSADHDLPRLELGQVYEFTSRSMSGGPVQRLGTEITRRATERLLDGPDWHRVEDWGVWSCGAMARLGFLSSPSAGDLVLYVNLRMPHGVADLGCMVLVNDVSQGQILLNGGRDHGLQVHIPGGQGPVIRLVLQAERILRPAVGQPDQRVLGVGLRSVCLCAADDPEARLAYFEKNVRTLEPVAHVA